MRLHHLALLTVDVDAVARFYASLLDLPELRRQEDPAGLRSVWLDLDGAILMVERADGGAVTPGPGWDGVYFRADAGSGPEWVERFRAAGAGPTHHTSFTVYGLAPDGSRFGVSSFPEPLFPDPAAPPKR